MASKKNSGYEVRCNFKEKLVEMDICRFFGAFTPLRGNAYFLEPAKEKLTGADLKSVDSKAIALYMQVKVSEGLKTIRIKKSSNRVNRSYLENIREYRHKLNLDERDDHFLYFQLRKKAKKAADLQHNILMSYANTGFSHAFYVAPLIIEKEKYQQQFLDFSSYPYEPFYYDGYRLHGEKWTSLFGFIPFLRNHISIVPHEQVRSHMHYYAFSQHGVDVTWHSPSLISNQPSRLSDAMATIFREYYNSEKKETLKTLSEKIREMPIMKNEFNDNDKLSNSEDPIEILSRHAFLLEKHYSIKQVIFTFQDSDRLI